VVLNADIVQKPGGVMMTDIQAPDLLQLDGVTKIFHLRPMFGQAREVAALRDVNLTIKAGKALAIVGESGSGKSTLGRAVIRLFQLSGGAVRFKGRDIATLHTRQERLAYLRSVQMVFQDPFAALNPAHTIRHHLQRPLQLHRGLGGEALDKAVRQVLADVEMDAEICIDKYPHELSGGQRQRINLARAIAVGAELVVADEPTSMLDVSIRRSVLDLMRRMKSERSISFLYITHDIATAQYLADEVAIMFGGRVVEWGPPMAIINDPQHPYTKLLLDAVPDPSVRLSGQDGKAFAARADAVREATRGALLDAVEVSRGHFVRQNV